MNQRELKRKLGEDHYLILKKVFLRKSDPNLTVNKMLGLYRKLIEIGLLKETSRISTAPGAPIEVVLKRDGFQDILDSWDLYDPAPDKIASIGNVKVAAEHLEILGITPDGA